MNKDFLITDCTSFAHMELKESTKLGATCFRGRFGVANEVNKNKRKYPFDVLNRNVESLTETIEHRGLYGELDHPTDSIVHLANVSHLVTKLWWEDNTLMGEAEILKTPSGMILKAILESGRVGISSRGVGNGQSDKDGVLIIGESYKLITFDVVADPSTYSAFQKMVVGKQESVRQETKNEASCIHKVNPSTLISYFGLCIQKQTRELKERLSQ